MARHISHVIHGENKCVTDMLHTIGLWYASSNKYVFRDRLNMLGSWIFLSNVGREFHCFGAVIAKAQSPNVLVNEYGCENRLISDRRDRFGLCSTSSSDKYSGAFPCTTRNVSSNILYVILCCIGSQWSCSLISEMCSWRGMHAITLAVAVWTRCSLASWYFGRPCKSVLQ